MSRSIPPKTSSVHATCLSPNIENPNSTLGSCRSGPADGGSSGGGGGPEGGGGLGGGGRWYGRTNRRRCSCY
jgi:hypothetical protein